MYTLIKMTPDGKRRDLDLDSEVTILIKIGELMAKLSPRERYTVVDRTGTAIWPAV